METSIIRSKPETLQNQLTDILKKRIDDGTYPPNAKLPSEREICEEFSVSRITVREVIRRLREENLVRVEAGRGTFVLPRERDITVKVSLEGFSTDLRKAGKVPGSKLLGIGVVELPSHELAEVMKLAPDDEIIKVERIRTVNEKPLALHTAWLNLRFCPDILEYNLAKLSLLSILKEEYHLMLKNATQAVWASIANIRERKLLSLPDPSSVLRETRTTYLDSGEIIEYSQATYCGDFYRLLINLDLNNIE